MVGADGTGEERLTGPVSDAYVGAGGGATPTWWPDGSRLFFASSRLSGDGDSTTYVMNADGTCEGRFAPAAPRLVDPAWRPGTAPAAGAIACVDLKAEVAASIDAVALKQSVVYHVTVDNDGTIPATGLQVTVSAPAPAVLSPSLAPGMCSAGQPIVCRLGTLGPLTSFVSGGASLYFARAVHVGGLSTASAGASRSAGSVSTICMRPVLQFGQLRSESTMQPTATRSPGLYFVTDEPTLVTRPTIS